MGVRRDELKEKEKPVSRDILFRLIDLLTEKVNTLEDTIECLKESFEELKTESNQPKLPEFLNCKQSCELLQMSTQTLNQRRKEGKIKAFRIGKNYMYELTELLKLGQPSKRVLK